MSKPIILNSQNSICTDDRTKWLQEEFIFATPGKKVCSVNKEGPEDSFGNEIHEGALVIQHLMEAISL